MNCRASVGRADRLAGADRAAHRCGARARAPAHRRRDRRAARCRAGCLVHAGAVRAPLNALGDELRFLMITSQARVHRVEQPPAQAVPTVSVPGGGVWLQVRRTSGAAKCVRCWHHRADVGSTAEHPELCSRCVANLIPARPAEFAGSPEWTRTDEHRAAMQARAAGWWLTALVIGAGPAEQGAGSSAALQAVRGAIVCCRCSITCARTIGARPSAFSRPPRAGSAGCSAALAIGRERRADRLWLARRASRDADGGRAGADPGRRAGQRDRPAAARLRRRLSFRCTGSEHYFPAFNVADSAITVGAALLLLDACCRAAR